MAKRGISSETGIIAKTMLNDVMDLHTSSLGTLVPGGTCCVFYAIRCQVYWGLIYNVVSCYYSCRHRCKDTAHSGSNRPTHLFINIYFNTTSYVATATMSITLNE